MNSLIQLLFAKQKQVRYCKVPGFPPSSQYDGILPHDSKKDVYVDDYKSYSSCPDFVPQLQIQILSCTPRHPISTSNLNTSKHKQLQGFQLTSTFFVQTKCFPVVAGSKVWLMGRNYWSVEALQATLQCCQWCLRNLFKKKKIIYFIYLFVIDK